MDLSMQPVKYEPEHWTSHSTLRGYIDPLATSSMYVDTSGEVGGLEEEVRCS